MTASKPLLFAFLLSFQVVAEDWPMYLKDLGHSSFVPTETVLSIKNIASLQPTWSYLAGASVGSAVTASGGTLYLGDWSGNLHAIDAQRGVQLWKSPLGRAAAPSSPTCFQAIGVSAQAVVQGDTVYAGGGDSAVYALNKSNGSQIWRTSLADPATGTYLWSSMVPYRDVLYVGVSSLGDCPIVPGAIARIDPQRPQTPLIRSMVPQGAVGGGIWSTPVVDEAANALFVTTANGDLQDVAAGYLVGAILKLDPDTLATQAYYLMPEEDALTDQLGGSSPILFQAPDGTPLLAVAQKNGILYAVRRSDLSLAWQTRVAVGCVDPGRGCGSISTPSFDGKFLYLGAGVRDPSGFATGSLYAIRPGDGSVAWRRDLNTTVLMPTTVANGLLYVATNRGMEIYDAATGQAVWSDKRRGTAFGQPVVVDGTVYSTYVRGELVAWNLAPPNSAALFSSNAASGIPSFAPNTAAASYGADLAGAQVNVEDINGVVRPAKVLYSSSGQVNYVVPPETPTGRATVTATAASGAVLSGVLQVNPVAPGLFSANASGEGVAAAQALRVGADGSRSGVSVFACAATCTSQPIDLGAATDRVFLLLYGTGIRNVTRAEEVQCTIGGVPATVNYAGPQGEFEGLDQVNVELPQSLRGRGEADVILSVDGQLSNTVRINIR